MTTELTDDTREITDLRLSTIFHTMSEDFIDSVVSHAVEHWQQASPEIRRDFEQMIRSGGIPIPGFRLNVPDSKLPKSDDPRLRMVVGRCAFSSDQDAGIVLRAWADSKLELRDRVKTRLDDLDVDAAYPDFSEQRFQTEWSDNSWMRVRDELAPDAKGFSKEDAALPDSKDFSREDAALMVCFVSGMLPQVALNTDDEPTSNVVDFDEVIEQLRNLEVGADEWDQTLDLVTRANDFVTQADEIIETRVAEVTSGLTESLNDAIAEVRAEFEPELTYLEVDLDFWHPEALHPVDDLFTATNLVEKLKIDLSYYRPIHPRASTRNHELSRAEDRGDYENAILATAVECQALLGDNEETPSDLSDINEKNQKPILNPIPVDSTVDDLVDAVVSQPRNGTAVNSQNSPDRLADQNRELNLEVTNAKAEIKNLRSKLKEARNRHKLVVRKGRLQRFRYNRAALNGQRLPYQRQNFPVVDDESVTVADAVETAECDMSDHLKFALNSNSFVEGNPFEKAGEVDSALQWLATIFHDAKTGQAPNPDLEHSIKETIGGWSYAPHQYGQTMARNSEAYTTVFEGKEYVLENHLRKGSNRDSRHTIRIAFAWDDHLKKVIVGYIGQHQPTRRD